MLASGLSSVAPAGQHAAIAVSGACCTAGRSSALHRYRGHWQELQHTVQKRMRWDGWAGRGPLPRLLAPVQHRLARCFDCFAAVPRCPRLVDRTMRPVLRPCLLPAAARRKRSPSSRESNGPGLRCCCQDAISCAAAASRHSCLGARFLAALHLPVAASEHRLAPALQWRAHQDPQAEHRRPARPAGAPTAPDAQAGG